MSASAFISNNKNTTMLPDFVFHVWINSNVGVNLVLVWSVLILPDADFSCENFPLSLWAFGPSRWQEYVVGGVIVESSPQLNHSVNGWCVSVITANVTVVKWSRWGLWPVKP